MHWGKHQNGHQHVTCINTNSPKPEEVTSQARTHARTHIHARTHAHTHTHTHTHTRMHEISNTEVFTAVETTSIKPCSSRCSCAGQGTSPQGKTTVCLKRILNWTNFPSKHASLIQKHSGYGHLRPVCSQNRPGSYIYMSDPTSCIRCSSVFPKKARIRLCKTDPDPIWMALSGFGQTHLVWKQAGVQESLGLVSGRMQPVHDQFPTFRLGSILPQTSWIILCKTSLDPI